MFIHAVFDKNLNVSTNLSSQKAQMLIRLYKNFVLMKKIRHWGRPLTVGMAPLILLVEPPLSGKQELIMHFNFIILFVCIQDLQNKHNCVLSNLDPSNAYL